jgi:hypothetical protein
LRKTDKGWLKPTDCDCRAGGGKYSSSNTNHTEGGTNVFTDKNRGSLLVLRSFPTHKRRDSDEYFEGGGFKIQFLPLF